MQIRRCKQCERYSDEPDQTDIWRTVKEGDLDFCSWGCVGKYADAKVKEKETKAEELRLGDKPQPREARGST